MGLHVVGRGLLLLYVVIAYFLIFLYSITTPVATGRFYFIQLVVWSTLNSILDCTPPVLKELAVDVIHLIRSIILLDDVLLLRPEASTRLIAWRIRSITINQNVVF